MDTNMISVSDKYLLTHYGLMMTCGALDLNHHGLCDGTKPLPEQKLTSGQMYIDALCRPSWSHILRTTIDKIKL